MATALTRPELLETLTRQTLELVDRGQLTPTILIDGRAGSGKSTLADDLQQLLFREGESLPRVIHMDDLYPGWNGLAAGAEYLNRQIFRVLERGQTASWQTYNWSTGVRQAWQEFSGGTPLIVEGVGALNRYSAERAQLRVWLEVPEEVRHQRWLDRDGNQFDEYWSVWAAQELDFIAAEHSPDLADFICRD